MINIAGLEKWAVLKALYDGAQPLGMGFLHARPGGLPEEDAKRLVGGDAPYEPGQSAEHRRALYFDYVGGRPLKVDLSQDEFDPRLYDRDQGHGAAERAIAGLRSSLTEVAS